MNSTVILPRRASSLQKGFTLIELMIVIVIVAILMGIAIPAYSDQVRKSRRAQAKADLLAATQAAERMFTNNNSYASFTLAGGATTQDVVISGRTWYIITLTGLAAGTFTLTATPQGEQAIDTCGTLTINQANVRTPNTPGCWN
jgi:type IV pilus assembly protein PilE